MSYQTLLMGGGLILFGLIVGYLIRRFVALRSANSVERRIKIQLEEAKTQAREIILKAKEKADFSIEEAQKDVKSRNIQLSRLEERLLGKEDQLEKQVEDLHSKQVQISQDVEKINAAKTRLNEMQKQISQELEKAAGLTREEARVKLIQDIKEIYGREIAQAIQKLEQQRKEEIEKKGLDIITTAIQRYARSHVSEVTTSIFYLPNEDIKGKIIGREGRNIRALERETGVELIIDETPDSVIISSFDPLRREVAKMALEKLIKDGRIQPVKIEEKVAEAQQELNKRIQEMGESATFETGVINLPKEIIQLLGRLHFRLSYGQNVLTHSIETAHLAGMMASELGLNVEMAKKAGLLHDIGKAIDHEVQGSHTDLGCKLLKKYGIEEAVIEAMQSHHEEYPFMIPEAFIVAAADTISAARPGARRDTVENYLKRMEDLEKIATSFSGVKSAYTVSAGREIRVFVIPEKIDDFGALQLAKNISSKIQTELKYPGEIKVNVIREVRAVEYAR